MGRPHISAPFSYTHLDVYKRQAHALFLQPARHIQNRFLGKRDKGVSLPHVIRKYKGPVLADQLCLAFIAPDFIIIPAESDEVADVYKRQPVSSASTGTKFSLPTPQTGHTSREESKISPQTRHFTRVVFADFFFGFSLSCRMHPKL